MGTLVLGGTRRSAALVDRLLDETGDLFVSVIRDSSRRMYPRCPDDRIRVGRLTAPELETWMEERQVQRVIDATHPYADRVTRNAVDVCERLERFYGYLDRPLALPREHDRLQRFERWETLVSRLADTVGGVLLTMGVRPLPHFQSIIEDDRVHIRVLPRPDSIQRAREAVDPERVIGLRPPRSVPIERTLIEELGIDCVVSKESGPSGGMDEKWQAVRETGIEMYVRGRPAIDVPHRTTDLDQAVNWVTDRAPVHE